jgi:hypothetical protein
MKKYSGIAAAACISLLSIIFISCPEFMGTSWGRWAKRSPEIPTITNDNLDSLLDAAVGDPEFAEALLKKLKKQAGSKHGEELAKFQGAAVAAAASGSGLDISVVTHLGDLINAATSGDGPDEDHINKITKIFNDIFNDVDHKTIHTLAEDLTEVLLIDKDVYNSTGYWEKPAVPSDSLLIAAVVLLMAEADIQNADNFSGYLEIFQGKREDKPENDSSLSRNEDSIILLVKQLTKKNSDTFSALLEGLKLDNIDNIF